MLQSDHPSPQFVSPSEYQHLARRTECNQRAALERIAKPGLTGDEQLRPVRLLHAVIGLMGEVGELAGAVERWLWYGQDLDVTNIREELGDGNWYAALAHNALDLDMLETMRANIRKLKERYPGSYNDLYAREENRNRSFEREALEATDAAS